MEGGTVVLFKTKKTGSKNSRGPREEPFKKLPRSQQASSPPPSSPLFPGFLLLLPHSEDPLPPPAGPSQMGEARKQAVAVQSCDLSILKVEAGGE